MLCVCFQGDSFLAYFASLRQERARRDVYTVSCTDTVLLYIHGLLLADFASLMQEARRDV